jgi:predicted nucleic acid-binding protein
MSRPSTPLYAVDTMVFVYHFEENPQFGPAAERLLRSAEQGDCRLVTSTLTMMEILVVPKREGQSRLSAFYREFFLTFPNLSLVPMDVEIAEIASDLRARHRLRTPDALHLATALQQRADGFVTQDARLPSLERLPILGPTALEF